MFSGADFITPLDFIEFINFICDALIVWTVEMTDITDKKWRHERMKLLIKVRLQQETEFSAKNRRETQFGKTYYVKLKKLTTYSLFLKMKRRDV